MNAPERPASPAAQSADLDALPATRSLLIRTTAVLGLALAVAITAMVLVLRPFLASSFESEMQDVLAEQELRARQTARVDDELTETLLRATTEQAFEAARAAVADAPIGMIVPDPAAAARIRAALDAELAARKDERRTAVGALRGEIDERTRIRLDADWGASRDRTTARSREFGNGVAARAAAGMLAFIAVLFLVHGWLLWRMVLAPVRRLVDATQEVGRGRLGTRIAVSSDDEVARLARSFNAMTESLERAHAELTALNATLEERVRQKTAEIEGKERALRHADKMASLGTLAGGVAHEFNNLLGGIQGCAEDAAREQDPEELRATLGMIERTARRGAAITQNLLRFARPASGERRPTDVREVVRDVAALVEPEAVRTNARIVVDAPSPVVVTADPSGLHQVLVNLATNGLHAMRGTGGTLTLSATPATDGGARIVVSDTGRGIAPEHRDRLFEPFFTTRAEGTGLGLSVSWGIVSTHGGRIEVDSSPGRGAAFTIVLPRDVPPGPAAAPAPSSPSQGVNP